MKLSFLFLSLLVSGSTALAEEKIVCREISGPKMTMVLTTGKELPTKPANDEEYVDFRYEAFIEIYTSNTRIAATSETGILETEDVHLQFKSNNKKISFEVYLDELEENTLIVNGKRIPLHCY